MLTDDQLSLSWRADYEPIIRRRTAQVGLFVSGGAA
jgi:hypothetical protein